MLVTIFGCWRQNFHIGDIFRMLVSDANAKIERKLVTKTVKTVTNISKLSPTHFVSNIRHQHRCNPQTVINNRHQYWSSPFTLVASKDRFSLSNSSEQFLSSMRRCSRQYLIISAFILSWRISQFWKSSILKFSEKHFMASRLSKKSQWSCSPCDLSFEITMLVFCSLSCVRMKKIKWSCKEVSEKIIHFEWNSIIENFEFWMRVFSEVSHICIILPSIEFRHEIFLINTENSK